MKNRIKKNTQITYTRQQVKKMKSDARLEGYNHALNVTMYFPLLVLNKYGWGEKRLKRFMADTNYQIECYNEGRFTLEDVAQTMYEEQNVRWEVDEQD